MGDLLRTTEQTDKIMPAFIKAQQSIQKVEYDRENPFAQSNYATLDAILGEVKPKLSEQGLGLLQIPVNRIEEGKEYVGIQTYIIHDSGQGLWTDPFFLIVEKGAKMNLAQSQGSTITYAKRYTLSSILGIATGEDNDGVVGEEGKTVSKEEQQAGKERDQFPEHKKEYRSRLAEVSKKTGKSFEELENYILGEIANRTNKEESSINVNNIGQGIGIVKVLEQRANKKQQEEQQSNEQQGSMFEGNTTQPKVNWG